MQTLSRLNRAYPGKDTTYVLDFVNEAEEVLAAFKTYYEDATLESNTDPNLIFDLRASLDAQGYYDDFEVDRVVATELRPGATHGDLFAAVEPVADRILRLYRDGHTAWKTALEKNDAAAEREAQIEMGVLVIFKANMQTFLRLYAFLSQIFNYGNTAIEKRAIFYRRLLPLLEFGREREGIDLSKVVLTHHHLKNLGKRTLYLGEGETPKLPPITEAGSGKMQDKEKIYMAELIAKLNELFGADTSDRDQLVYVKHVIMGKLLESETLRQQAANNTKEQFANSPDLNHELQNATIASLDAHSAMATRVLNSPSAQKAMMDILLNHSQLWENLRGQLAS